MSVANNGREIVLTLNYNKYTALILLHCWMLEEENFCDTLHNM